MVKRFLFPLLLASACVGDEPVSRGLLMIDAGAGSDAQVAMGDAASVTDAADAATICDNALVSLYHGENNTLDALTRNPAFWPSAARYTEGRIGAAFDLEPPLNVVGVAPKTNAPFVGLAKAAADAGASQSIDALTISAWVRRAHPDAGAAASGVGLGPLVQFLQPPSAANVNIRNVLTFGINLSGFDPFVQIRIGPAGAETVVNFDTNSVPGPTDWTHYVVVFKQTPNTETSIQAFVNSVSKGIKPFARAMPQIPQDAYLELGGYNNEMSRTFASALDEVAIYKRALSDGEVAALYASRTPLNCP
jgi:Concanavalin A-like lectin/glucanases superfamily